MGRTTAAPGASLRAVRRDAPRLGRARAGRRDCPCHRRVAAADGRGRRRPRGQARCQPAARRRVADRAAPDGRDRRTTAGQAGPQGLDPSWPAKPGCSSSASPTAGASRASDAFVAGSPRCRFALRCSFVARAPSSERQGTRFGWSPHGKAMSITPGPRSAAYRVEAQVGRGGMGVVYRATDTDAAASGGAEADRTRARRGHPLFRRRFLRESQLAASLDHPNVIPIYEAGEDRGAALPGHAPRRRR